MKKCASGVFNCTSSLCPANTLSCIHQSHSTLFYRPQFKLNARERERNYVFLCVLPSMLGGARSASANNPSSTTNVELKMNLSGFHPLLLLLPLPSPLIPVSIFLHFSIHPLLSPPCPSQMSLFCIVFVCVYVCVYVCVCVCVSMSVLRR